MTNTEMDAVQVHNTVVFLQSAFTPRFKLLREGLIQAADGTGAGSHSHEGLSHFSYLVSTGSSHKHLRQSFCNMRFKAAVALERLRMELPFTIPGHIHVLDPTWRGHEIPLVRAVAIAFALGCTFSPGCSNHCIQFFTHDEFYHRPNSALSQDTQMLMKFLLIGQRWRWGLRGGNDILWCDTLFLRYRHSFLLLRVWMEKMISSKGRASACSISSFRAFFLPSPLHTIRDGIHLRI